MDKGNPKGHLWQMVCVYTCNLIPCRISIRRKSWFLSNRISQCPKSVVKQEGSNNAFSIIPWRSKWKKSSDYFESNIMLLLFLVVKRRATIPFLANFSANAFHMSFERVRNTFWCSHVSELHCMSLSSIHNFQVLKINFSKSFTILTSCPKVTHYMRSDVSIVKCSCTWDNCRKYVWKIVWNFLAEKKK